MIKAIIFDFDGVIADTEPLHYRAAAAVLDARGIRVSEDDFYMRLMGLSDDAFFRKVLNEAGRSVNDAIIRELLREKNARYEAVMYRELKPLPGVDDFVYEASQRGPTAVCSGARRLEIVGLLRQFGFDSWIKTIISIDEARVSKPDPTGYHMTLQALQRMSPSLSAEECLVIEDSLHGIAAAKSAGMPVLAVQTHYDASQLTSADASVPGLDGLTPDQAGELVKSKSRD